MFKYYLRKIKHRMPILPAVLLNELQSRQPKARFFVRNILKIDIDKILVGDIHGISSFDWYKLTGDSSRLEERLIESPYFELFEAIQQGTFKESDIKNYRYFHMASLCIKKLHTYCGCRNEQELLSYIRKLQTYFSEYKKNGNDGSTLFISMSQIRDTAFYEIIDGHHRVAIEAILGRKYVYGLVVGQSFSGIQKKLFQVSMTRSKELYQPINKLTVIAWPTIRNCQDRFEMLSAFLKKSKEDLAQLTLLDIACSYGYFVKNFASLGIQARGLEIDKNAIMIGKLSYDLQAGDYIQSSLQDYLGKADEQHDIVCFFSILHHFGLKKDFGGGKLEIEVLVRKLDEITKKYLFLDSGQNHEDWFKNKLLQWDDDFIIGLIMRNSHFTSYEKLGVDSDNVGKYSGNYNRSLFVFKK